MQNVERQVEETEELKEVKRIEEDGMRGELKERRGGEERN